MCLCSASGSQRECLEVLDVTLVQIKFINNCYKMHFTDTYVVWSKYIIHKIIVLRIWHVLVFACALELPTYVQVFVIPCGKEYCLRQIRFERHCGQQFLQKWDTVQLIKAK
jgi:hypothetical protein